MKVAMAPKRAQTGRRRVTDKVADKPLTSSSTPSSSSSAEGAKRHKSGYSLRPRSSVSQQQDDLSSGDADAENDDDDLLDGEIEDDNDGDFEGDSEEDEDEEEDFEGDVEDEGDVDGGEDDEVPEEKGAEEDEDAEQGDAKAKSFANQRKALAKHAGLRVRRTHMTSIGAQSLLISPRAAGPPVSQCVSVLLSLSLSPPLSTDSLSPTQR